MFSLAAIELNPICDTQTSKKYDKKGKFSWKSVRDLKSNSNDNSGVLNPAFVSGLTLLQANIVTLCLKVGLHPECLWPVQAMLLNLNLLHQHCIMILQSSNSRPFIDSDYPEITHNLSSCIHTLSERYKTPGLGVNSIDDVNADDWQLVDEKFE